MATTTNESLTNAGPAATLNDTTGLTVVDGDYTAAATTTISDATTEKRPLANFYLTVTFASAVAAAGKTLDIYLRYINIDGTNDEPVPGVDSYFQGHYRGGFSLGDGATQYIVAEKIPTIEAGEEAEVYLVNNSGQTINACKLVMLPHGFVPAT